jgi:ATP-dependent exoDNAse (exonuclease V) alpha subunit
LEMSFYHLNAQIIGRSNGRSAVAAAAYRAGETLTCERTGEVHDYSPRRGIVASGIVAPDDAPDWTLNRERLWNAVEAREKRKDAQLSREFNLAFPDGLSDEQRREVLDTFLEEQITSRGLVADWAIHRPSSSGDQRNWHAHVMTTMRTVSADGFDPIKDQALNRREQLVEWRQAWAEIQNEAFERYQIRDAEGNIRKVDHRSYEARGLDIEPTVHVGPHATAMERRGHPTERGDLNREIREINHERQAVRRKSEHLTNADVQTQIVQHSTTAPKPESPANDNEPKPDLTRRKAQVLPADDDSLSDNAKRLERLRKAFEKPKEPDKTQDHDHTPEP